MSFTFYFCMYVSCGGVGLKVCMSVGFAGHDEGYGLCLCLSVLEGCGV